MICLTGDLHHASLGTGNQRCSDITEMEAARRYLALLREASVKVTFFVTGRAFAEEWPELAPICDDPLVEIGGHTYACFEPALLHRVSKKLIGSYNGPPPLERRDVRRTIDVIRRRTGRTIRLWRDHMYMHGRWTDGVLAREGIVACSDAVRRSPAPPRWSPEGILEIPINVIPDHEHLYHAERTRAWVERWRRRYRWSDAFGPASYEIDEWVEIVLEGLSANEAAGALSTMIVHPITMYLCDDFRGFRRILEYLSRRETVHMGAIVAAAERARSCA